MDYSQQELSSLANRLADKIQFRRPSIGTHTDYVLGKRGKLKFASKEFKRYMSDRFSDFSDNWCLPVAQAPVERIKFKGFVPYDDVKLGTGIMKCLDRNDFERGLQEAALMMTTTGRAFALVTQVDGRARITFEHPDSAAVIYDARTGQPSAGFLIQQGDDKEYGTLMLPGWTVSMERKKMLDLTDQRVPPDVYGWKMNDPQPTGLDTIPLREFRNQMLLDNAPISDIAHVESMQDTVNVVWAYLLNALDYASLPARVILGGDPLVEPVYNEEGQQVGEKPIELDKQVLERIYQFTGDNVNLGEWSSSNLNVFIPVIEKAVEHIAAETRTPRPLPADKRGGSRHRLRGRRSRPRIQDHRTHQLPEIPHPRHLQHRHALRKRHGRGGHHRRLQGAVRDPAVSQRDADGGRDAQVQAARLPDPMGRGADGPKLGRGAAHHAHARRRDGRPRTRIVEPCPADRRR